MHHYKDKLAKDSKKFTLKLFLHKQRIFILIMHHCKDKLAKDSKKIALKYFFTSKEFLY